MRVEDALREIGLSKGEAAVYTALLRLGESKVHKIKQETKMHRTTIYDFLDGLVRKGLASYVLKNNVKFYRAAHPSKLESLIREKEEFLKESMSRLLEISELDKKRLKVDVYEGTEGFKTMLNKVLREAGEFLSFGVEESKFEEKFPHIMKSFFKREQTGKIPERVITKKGIGFTYQHPHMKYRYLEQKYFSPVPTVIFGNNVGFLIWEPMHVILIENKDLADAYRKHFELLWSIADKKP